MTESRTAEALRFHLDNPDWNDSANGVTRVVSESIKSADPHVSIRTTGYFNHSFVPDIILEWPSGDTSRREVFIRLNTSDAFLYDDLSHLGNSSPLIIDIESELEPGNRQEYEHRNDLAELAADSDILLTRPSTVEEMKAQHEGFVAVLPGAILRGGRGEIDANKVGIAKRAIGDLFAGSVRHEPQNVLSGDATVSQFLRQAERSRIIDFARIVWDSSGTSGEPFPLQSSLSSLDDAALRFLLEEAPEAPQTFWRSIGRNVSLDRLIQVARDLPGPLDHFVQPNADMRAGYVFVRGRELSESDAPRWDVKGSTLRLELGSMCIYFLPKGSNATVPDGSRSSDLMTVDKLAARLGTHGHSVRAAKLRSKDSAKRFTYETIPDKTPLLNDEMLAGIGDKFVVESIEIDIEKRSLYCYFDSLKACGPTSTSFTIAEFLEHAVGPLWPTSTDEQDVISSLVATAAPERGQGTLF